jgi:hypothetical protein
MNGTTILLTAIGYVWFCSSSVVVTAPGGAFYPGAAAFVYALSRSLLRPDLLRLGQLASEHGLDFLPIYRPHS